MAEPTGTSSGMSPFESFMTVEKIAKKPSGAAIGGLVTAVAAGVGVLGAVLLSTQSSRNSERNIDRLTNYALQEHAERVYFQDRFLSCGPCGHGFGGHGFGGYGYSPLAPGATNQPQPIAVTMCEPAHVRNCGC